MARPYRPVVELQDQLLSELGRTCDARGGGPTVGCLIYFWVLSAARLALAGHGHLLPRAQRTRRGTLGPVTGHHWTQPRVEYDQCADAIKAAGSSISAVVRSAARLYVDCGGDGLRMPWPAPGVELPGMQDPID